MRYNMDADIIKAILRSDAGNVAQTENCEDMSRETLLYSQSNIILNTLCTSLSNLLCYKVSKEAYQRYSIRLLIIDILRKWCRTTNSFNYLQIFTSKENSLKFVSILVGKYLDDILNECYSEDALISLTIAMMHLSVENLLLMPYVDKLLLKILQLEVNDKVKNLLHNALHSNIYFHLQLSTKEKIYVSQKFKLLEEPLLNSFICTLSQGSCTDSQKNKEEELNQLLEFSTQSACVFQLIFSFLKELLVQLQYAPAVLHFIDATLKRISLFCENRNRNLLDLYPRKLHSCIILLRIKPEHHTVRTRDYTLNILTQIFNENKDTLLILTSHFSEWLEYFANNVQS